MIKKTPIIDISGKDLIDLWNKRDRWRLVMNAPHAIKWEYENHDEAIQVWKDVKENRWLVTLINKNKETGTWGKIDKGRKGLWSKEEAMEKARTYMKERVMYEERDND